TIYAQNAVNYSIDDGTTYLSDSIFYNLGAGSYMIMVQDAGNCTDFSIIDINEPAIIELYPTFTDENCGASDGSAQVIVSGGTIPYTYLWSNGSTDYFITGLSEGIYSVTITDNNACSSDTSVYVGNSGSTLILSFTGIISPYCFGDSNGSATVVVSGTGPFDYIWSNGDTTTTISDIAGTYYVTVSDQSGCSGIDTVLIIQPDALAFNIINIGVSCFGYQDGQIYSNVSGGTPSYSYSWIGPNSFSSANANISDLSPGGYCVTVIDGNSCAKIDTFTVYTPTQILANENITNVSCIGNDDGNILLSVTGGTVPYSFIWNTDPVQNDSSVTNLFANDYSVTITDFNNCTAVYQYAVTDGTDFCLNIPNVFTPNGDAVNDKWEITGIQRYSEVKIEIFNRWGDVIYTYSGSGSGYKSLPWDGTFNGRELPISSYIYILDLKDGSEPYNGIVTIKK
ncbi:MAG: gliding motility-associated C-terminal domain-containing protein, partial [Bacteroidota bacterium]